MVDDVSISATRFGCCSFREPVPSCRRAVATTVRASARPAVPPRACSIDDAPRPIALGSAAVSGRMVRGREAFSVETSSPRSSKKVMEASRTLRDAGRDGNARAVPSPKKATFPAFFAGSCHTTRCLLPRWGKMPRRLRNLSSRRCDPGCNRRHWVDVDVGRSLDGPPQPLATARSPADDDDENAGARPPQRTSK